MLYCPECGRLKQIEERTKELGKEIETLNTKIKNSKNPKEIEELKKEITELTALQITLNKYIFQIKNRK